MSFAAWSPTVRPRASTSIRGRSTSPGRSRNARRQLGGASTSTRRHWRFGHLGRSESIPVVDGALELGEFGRIYFADFDQMRPRRRQVRVTFVGESGARSTD